MRSTDRNWNEIKRLREALRAADTVLAGAGSGLSASAGFTYSGKRFEDNFSDFIEKYGFQDMYSAGFYPFGSPEEYWAYWSRYVRLNRYQDPPRPVYRDLLELVREKDYFVLTTNVDHCFQKAGFDRHRLFYTQGDYGLFQCSRPCHAETYDNEAVIRAMAAGQRKMRVPSSLIPHCPACGAPMAMNLRADHTFVEDAGWHRAAGRYEDFVRRHQGLPILYLELGVGGNTPGIIKFPFWRMALQNPRSVYACVSLSDAFASPELGKRAICVSEDIGAVLEQLFC